MAIPKWSQDEHGRFLQAIERCGTGSSQNGYYNTISRFVGGDKQPSDVKIHIQDHLIHLRKEVQQRELKNPWSWAENKRFEDAIAQYLGKGIPQNQPIPSVISWEQILNLFPGRSVEDLKLHFQKLSFDVMVSIKIVILFIYNYKSVTL